MTSDLLQQFIIDCLDYPHWVQNRGQLGQDLKEILEKQLSPQEAETLFREDLIWPQQIQVFELEQHEDFQACIEKVVKKDCGNTPVRFIYDPTMKKILAMILHPNHCLEIRMFDKKVVVWKGELRPLKMDRRLHFSSDLELLDGRQHKVEIAPYVTAQFTSENQAVTGSVVRGYIFQKLVDLKSEPLENSSKLFYFVRKIENHFLKRESNPFHQGLVADLEKNIQLIRLGDQSALNGAADLIARSQNALEYVFGSDKLLSLLIKDLQHTLNQNAQVSYVSHSLEQTPL